MNSPNGTFTGGCRCPACGHIHPPLARTINAPLQCSACASSFQIIDDRGRTKILGTSGTGTQAIRKPPAAEIKDPSSDSYKPATQTVGQSVACPYCNAKYPFKQILCGRPLRCTQCAGVFLIVDAATVQPVKDPPSKEPAAAAASEQPPPLGSSEVLQRKIPKKSSGQIDTIRAMSRRMQDLAKVALNEPDQNTQSTKGYRPPTARLSKVSGALTQVSSGQGGASSKSVSQVRTGKIERKTSRVIKPSGRYPFDLGPPPAPRRTPWIRIALAAIAVLIAIWFFWPLSEERRLLRAFDDRGGNIAGSSGASLAHHDAIIQAGGMVEPIRGLSGARFSSVTRHDLSGLSAAVGNYRLLTPEGPWISNEHFSAASAVLQAAEAAMAEHLTIVSSISEDDEGGTGAVVTTEIPEAPPSPRAVLTEAAQREGWALLHDQDIAARFQQFPEAGPILSRIFLASSGANSVLREHYAQGNLPTALELRAFSGRNGIWVMGYSDPVKVNYQGTILRLVGAPFDNTWRLFELKSSQ